MFSNKQFTKLLTAAAVFLCLGASPAFAAEPGGHSHDHAAAPARLSLDAGRKWATDEPLRKAMTKVRNAMDQSLQPIHQGKFSAARYAALAKTINGEVSYMVSNCKLEPKADAQLHLIVAELLAGAEAMEGKSKNIKRQDGALKILGALENYGGYFDDPTWKPIAH
jgi:hypothetical protein